MLEPTEKVKTFLVEANELAIVDARVIKDMNPKHPLIKGAILIPGDNLKNAFNVTFDYDEKDHLNGLTVVPTESKVFGPMNKGSSPAQAVGKHMGIKAMQRNRPDSTKGQKGKMADPVKSIVNKIAHIGTRQAGEREMQSPRGKAKQAKAALHAPAVGPTMTAESQEILSFLKDISVARTVREEAIAGLSNKHLAKNVLDKLLGLSLGGWELKEGKLYNEAKNQFVDGSKWDIRDGLLFTKEGKRPEVDFDMIYEARGKLQAILDQDNAKEFATIEESLAALTGKSVISS